MLHQSKEHGLPITVTRKARALFNVAVDAIVGNGEEILFWTNGWLDGHTMAEIAPNLFKTIQKRTTKRRTVAQALHNRSWVQDIKGARTVEVLLEFLHIWDMVDGFILQLEIPDRYNWKLTLLAPWISGTDEPTTHQRCRPHTMARGRRREGEQSMHTHNTSTSVGRSSVEEMVKLNSLTLLSCSGKL